MLPWAGNLVASAHLTAGERVLDLACGTGFVGRTAKSIAGAEGVVIGVDLNPMMVAVARSSVLLVYNCPLMLGMT